MIDATVVRYVVSTISVFLKIFLVVAILGFFEVQTATFAALLAAAGLAIGAAWSGLLSNFAAGAFLIIFRLLKVGDFVCAGGVTGIVEGVGLFATNHCVDPVEGMNLVKPRVSKIQNVLSNPEPVIEILKLAPTGSVIAVRPFFRNENYWQVYFDTNKTVMQAFGEAGYPPPNLTNFVRT